MKKNTVKSNIKTLNRISSRMPKTLNEAINFNEDDDALDYYDEDDYDFDDEQNISNKEKTNMHDRETIGSESPNVENFIANMRKESLGIMKSLADNPDDAVYQFAKKIFQLADKAHEDQKEGKDINGQPKNEHMMHGENRMR